MLYMVDVVIRKWSETEEGQASVLWMVFELFVNSRSIVLPARWVGQSYCWMRKWSMAKLYSADTISFSSVVAPDLHCPVIQSA